MFYRETGQFKTSYTADQAIFPIAQDRWFMALLFVVLFVVVPSFATEYTFQAIMIPVLMYSVAAIGLNLLTGYCGQLSLGTGGFMAVGAVACFKLTTAFPEMNILIVLLASGLITAFVTLATTSPTTVAASGNAAGTGSNIRSRMTPWSESKMTRMSIAANTTLERMDKPNSRTSCVVGGAAAVIRRRDSKR